MTKHLLIGKTILVLLIISNVAALGTPFKRPHFKVNHNAPQQSALEEIANAMGGKDRILGIKTMILEGHSRNSNIMNRDPNETLVIDDQTDWKRSVDLVNNRARQEALSTPTYPTPVVPGRQIIAIDGQTAFAIGGGILPTNAPPRAFRQPVAVAMERRVDLILRDPIGVLQTAFASETKLSEVHISGTLMLVDVYTVLHDTITLAFDSKTKLPAYVSTKSSHFLYGDITNKTVFSDYKTIDGIQIAMRRTSSMDRFPTTDIELGTVLLNTDIGDLSAPSNLPPLTTFPPQPPVSVQQLAPGIWLLGPAYYSLLVEFDDHTELIEAPQGDGKTLGYVAEARKIVPNKPLTKVVVTHHHADHIGGIRAAIEEKLTLVTYKLNKKYFEEIAGRPHTRFPDTLAKNPQPVKIETVGEEKIVKGKNQEMHLIHVEGNPHSETTLLIYFPQYKMAVNADLWDSRFPSYPFIANLDALMKKKNIIIERWVDIHNGMKTKEDFEKALEANSKH